MPRMLDIAEQIFEDSLAGKTSRLGIAIKDCRNKETMVVTRYGGDACLVFFDNKTKQVSFYFVVEMANNTKQKWCDVFQSFVQLRANLVQK